MESNMSATKFKVAVLAAVRAATHGTDAQIDALETLYGCSLSTHIDNLWAEAEERGDTRSALQLERAYNHLTR